MDELKEALRGQEQRNKIQVARQERRAFWTDYWSDELFLLLGLGVSAFTGLGSA